MPQSPSIDDLNKDVLLFAKSGNLDGMARAIEQGADLEARDEYGATPLIQAASMGRTDCVEYLLKAGANVHAREDEFHMTAFFAAVHNEVPEECMQILIDAGSDIEARDRFGNTVLYWVMQRNPYTPLLEPLIKVGADPDYRLGTQKSMWDAAPKDAQQMLQHLIDDEPKIDDKTTKDDVLVCSENGGFGMLSKARYWRNFDKIVQQLEQNGDPLQPNDVWQYCPRTQEPFLFTAASCGALPKIVEWRQQVGKPLGLSMFDIDFKGRTLFDILGQQRELEAFIECYEFKTRQEKLQFCQKAAVKYEDQVASHMACMMVMSNSRLRNASLRPL